MKKNPNAAHWRTLGKGLEPHIKSLYAVVAGSDEVGTGACAGPIVAAAVIFPANCVLPYVKDSKKYSSREARERAAANVKQAAVSCGIGIVSVDEIAKLNSNTRSGYLAHRRAVLALSQIPDAIIVDGEFDIPGLPKQILQFPSAKADQTCPSVSAASVIAKVFRDDLMRALAQEYEAYGWDVNAGYLTEGHMAAVKKFGVTPLHRHYFCRKIEKEAKNPTLYP